MFGSEERDDAKIAVAEAALLAREADPEPTALVSHQDIEYRNEVARAKARYDRDREEVMRRV